MNYEETAKLEKHVKIKIEADNIHASFLKNIELKPKNYAGGGRFIISSDEHNTAYITLRGDVFILECRFLHESYDVEITPRGIFSALQKKYRGVDHLKSYCGDK